MAHNSFKPGSRTPELAPSRANLPLLSPSRGNLPPFCSKVLANCVFEEDFDLDADYYCTDQIPRQESETGQELQFTCRTIFIYKRSSFNPLMGQSYV